MSLESTRVTLLKCMRKLMRQNSFSKISVDSICEAAHISRRTFYRHFPDKYSLLEATYRECFYDKLHIAGDDLFWDIFCKICAQIDADREFFRHALEVQGQNGFCEMLVALWVPLFKKGLPLNKVTDAESTYYTEQTVNMIITQIRKWINGSMSGSPAEFAAFVRSTFAVYGAWTYQLATNQPRSEFSENYTDEITW